MSLSMFLLVSFLAVVASSPFNKDYDEAWEKFKELFERNYCSTEEGARRQIFEGNAHYIAKHNLEASLGIHSYTLEINHFADMTEEEVKNRTYCSIPESKPTNETKWFSALTESELPTQVDWRTEGYVTAVKNQENCGSCWCFGATGSLEGQHKARTGKLVSLSEQNLLDCNTYESLGCNGGRAEWALKYIIKNKGIDTEEAYPYEAKVGICRFNRSAVGATCESYITIPYGNEKLLQHAVATVGPIATEIDATSRTFQMYSGGIYDNPSCSANVNTHYVLVVGYGSENGQDYWIAKNSWGTKWGNEGYIQMSRNRGNQCGIASRAVFPVM